MATNYLKAGGMLKFVDTVEDDGFIFPAKNCEMIEVGPGDNTSVILTFSESGDHGVQNVDLTCTAGKADEVAAIMADYIATGTYNGVAAGVTEVIAATTPILDVTTVATTKTLS